MSESSTKRIQSLLEEALEDDDLAEANYKIRTAIELLKAQDEVAA